MPIGAPRRRRRWGNWSAPTSKSCVFSYALTSLADVREHPSPEEAESNGADMQDSSAARAVGEHIFDKLRGSNNLVFAGSRGNVELYADLLRRRARRDVFRTSSSLITPACLGSIAASWRSASRTAICRSLQFARPPWNSGSTSATWYASDNWRAMVGRGTQAKTGAVRAAGRPTFRAPHVRH